MTAFDELTKDEQQYIRDKVSHLNVNPELLRACDLQYLLAFRKPDDELFLNQMDTFQRQAK